MSMTQADKELLGHRGKSLLSPEIEAGANRFMEESKDRWMAENASDEEWKKYVYERDVPKIKKIVQDFTAEQMSALQTELFGKTQTQQASAGTFAERHAQRTASDKSADKSA